MDSKTKEIQDWWDNNPFTLGVATNNYKEDDLVGRKPIDQMDTYYFEEVERKFRKHHGLSCQDENCPLLSNFIDYNSIKGKKVLDIATGTGLHSVEFAKNAADVTSIDLTEFAVMQTKKNLELRGLKGDVIQMDAQHMAFSNNTFDLINAWGCLMHMPDTEGAIREIHRVIKPEGRVLAYMYNKSSWPFWFNVFLLRGILGLGLIRYLGNIDRLTSRYSDGSHKNGNMLTKFYSSNQVKKMFKDAGFSKVDVSPLQIDHEPSHWPMRIFPIFKYLPKKVKAFMSKRWGYGLIVKATK